MAFNSRRLRVPARLCFVVLMGATPPACGSGGSSVPDATADGLVGADAPFEGGTCTIKKHPGRVCVTACIVLETPKNVEVPCELYCDLPDAGKLAGACFLVSGVQNTDCTRHVYPDGGDQVLC
jgi:hypothetical protein